VPHPTSLTISYDIFDHTSCWTPRHAYRWLPPQIDVKDKLRVAALLPIVGLAISTIFFKETKRTVTEDGEVVSPLIGGVENDVVIEGHEDSSTLAAAAVSLTQ
jgi:hypothetical protein